MALPQRQSNEGQSPNTYQYQVRNAQKVERRGLVSDVEADPRLMSSDNPTLREREERIAKKAADQAKSHLPEHSISTPNVRPTIPGRKKILSLRNNKKLFKYAKTTTVSASIVAWGMSLWTIQVIFALISTIFLGLMGAGDAVISSNLVTRIGGWLVERAVEGGTWLISGTAISVSDIGAGVFMALYMVVFAIGFGTLCAASFQYMASLIQPLSGEHSGTKYVAFLIAILGYATPILNLFPWFLVFVAVVWKYPK